jgi:hypothetical protein
MAQLVQLWPLGWMAEVRFPARLKISLYSTASRPALVLTQFPIQWEPGALTPGVKRSGLGADHSPPSGAEVKNMSSRHSA